MNDGMMMDFRDKSDRAITGVASCLQYLKIHTDRLLKYSESRFIPHVPGHFRGGQWNEPTASTVPQILCNSDKKLISFLAEEEEDMLRISYHLSHLKFPTDNVLHYHEFNILSSTQGQLKECQRTLNDKNFISFANTPPFTYDSTAALQALPSTSPHLFCQGFPPYCVTLYPPIQNKWVSRQQVVRHNHRSSESNSKSLQRRMFEHLRRRGTTRRSTSSSSSSSDSTTFSDKDDERSLKTKKFLTWEMCDPDCTTCHPVHFPDDYLEVLKEFMEKQKTSSEFRSLFLLLSESSSNAPPHEDKNKKLITRGNKFTKIPDVSAIHRSPLRHYSSSSSQSEDSQQYTSGLESCECSQSECSECCSHFESDRSDTEGSTSGFSSDEGLIHLKSCRHEHLHYPHMFDFDWTFSPYSQDFSSPSVETESDDGDWETARKNKMKPSKERTDGKRCNFCLSRKEKDVSHQMKDSNGFVVCPVLQRKKCPICGATGYAAHTAKHCPFRSGN